MVEYEQKYAMQQALKAMLGQMPQEKSPFSNPSMFPQSSFQFPSGASNTTGTPVTLPSPAASKPAVTIDVPMEKVEATTSNTIREDVGTSEEPKKYGV